MHILLMAVGIGTVIVAVVIMAMYAYMVFALIFLMIVHGIYKPIKKYIQEKREFERTHVHVMCNMVTYLYEKIIYNKVNRKRLQTINDYKILRKAYCCVCSPHARCDLKIKK